jgi:hypothetical protein
MRTNENQKKKTHEEQFSFEVRDALGKAFEKLESEITAMNLDFADDVRLSAREHGMSREQIDRVLVGFAVNDTDISAYLANEDTNILLGLKNVVDAFRAAYDLLLGEGSADRIFALTQEEATPGQPDKQLKGHKASSRHRLS